MEATCTQEGYTGNIYCAVCGEWLENGEDIPCVPHTLENVTGAREASCTREGYTGTGTCSVCGEVVRAKPAPALSTRWWTVFVPYAAGKSPAST